MMKHFERFMASLSEPTILAGGVVLVGVVGFLDFATGADLSLSFFYLLPICLVTWYVGRWPGVAVSLLSAGVWLLADYLDVPASFAHSLIPYWNALMRLGFFLITTWALSELQRTLAHRRALERIFLHDILNVTGSIRGFTELLQDDKIADKKEIYSLIRSAVEPAFGREKSPSFRTGKKTFIMVVSV